MNTRFRGNVCGDRVIHTNTSNREASGTVNTPIIDVAKPASAGRNSRFTAYTEWQGVYAGDVHGFARADYQWRGDSVRDASIQSSLANYRYNGWAVANVNIGAEWAKFQMRLFVDNVFNKDPPIDFVNSWGQWRISTLRPRTVGLSVGMKF